MNASPVLIKACLNGARPPGAHPALPVTPAQLASAAAAARQQGAGTVHLHVRAPDGRESLLAADVSAALRAVRDACPGLPLGVSTGAWILRDTARRLEHVNTWRDLPDFASVNWSEDGAEELARTLLEMGVGVEAGLFTVADAEALVTNPLAPRCLRALVEVRSRDGTDAVTRAGEMDAVLKAAIPALSVLHHGFADETWPVIEAALRAGRDVRIGLEDTFTLPDGSPAADNADLVAAAVALARRLGREPSKP